MNSAPLRQLTKKLKATANSYITYLASNGAHNIEDYRRVTGMLSAYDNVFFEIEELLKSYKDEEEGDEQDGD